MSSSLVLRPHQKEFIEEFFLNRHHGLIAVHPTGSGKTIMALTLAEEYLARNPAQNIILVAPKTLVYNYQKEIEKLGGVKDISKYRMFTIEGFYYGYSKHELTNVENKPELITAVDESSEDEEEEIAAFDNNLTIEEQEFLNAANGTIEVDGRMFSTKNSLMIIDEGHNLRTEIKVNINNQIKGKRPLVYIEAANKADRVVILTATPLINYPSDVANLISMVTRDNKGKYISKREFQDFLEKGTDKQIQEYFGGKFHFHSLSPADLLEYPKVEYHNVYMKMPDALYNWYKAQEAYLNKVSEDQIEGDFFNNDLSYFYTGVRQASNLSPEEMEGLLVKSEWVLKFIQTNPEQKFVVYSQYIKYGINLVRAALDKAGIDYVIITGGVASLNKRREALIDYNENKVKVILISSSGREGIDLKWTDHIIIMENGWNVPNEKQIVGRGVRRGSHINHPTSTVHVHRLLMVKPDEYEYGSERILAIPGPKNHVNAYKSIDLLLMSLAIWKQEQITNMFESIKKYNMAVKKTIEFLENQVESAVDIMNQYIIVSDGSEPIIFNRDVVKGLIDSIMMNLPDSTIQVLRIPIISLRATPQCPILNRPGEFPAPIYFEAELETGIITIYLCAQRYEPLLRFGKMHTWLTKYLLTSTVRSDMYNNLNYTLLDRLDALCRKINIYVQTTDKIVLMKALGKIGAKMRNKSTSLPLSFATLFKEIFIDDKNKFNFFSWSNWSGRVLSSSQGYYIQFGPRPEKLVTGPKTIHFLNTDNSFKSYIFNQEESISSLFNSLDLVVPVLYLNQNQISTSTLVSNLPNDSILTSSSFHKLDVNSFGAKEFKDI